LPPEKLWECRINQELFSQNDSVRYSWRFLAMQALKDQSRMILTVLAWFGNAGPGIVKNHLCMDGKIIMTND